MLRPRAAVHLRTARVHLRFRPDALTRGLRARSPLPPSALRVESELEVRTRFVVSFPA